MTDVSAPLVDLAEIERLVEEFEENAVFDYPTRDEVRQALLTAIRQLASAPVAVSAELRALSEKAGDGEWFVEHAYTDSGLSAIVDGRQHGIFPVKGEAHEINLAAAAVNHIRALLAAEDGRQLASRTAPASDAGSVGARAQPHACPAGWQCVPIEPTREMSEAGWARSELANSEYKSCTPRQLYRAMLAAAPHPPVGEKAAAQPKETSNV